ncbi:MAG: response regulator transcription factor [Bryobacterales bacterium]|nr:response regulator transcription factor [Bryobacterales bacterium]MDE0623370.1 response regulator transcription factor [Bryobacterales bacterium]
MKRILIVEDETNLAKGLQFNLEAEGFATHIAPTGEAGLTAVKESPAFDALLVDVMLPGIDGFHLVRELRSRGCFVPVMMLTARRRPQDIVEGLAAGADDYVPKPFELAVLLARIRGLLRRHRWSAGEQVQSVPDRYEFNGRTVDFANQRIEVGGESRSLTLTEAKLLHYLIAHEGRTVSRKNLLEDVWGVREDTDTRAIDNFIVRLRRSIEPDPAKPRHLVTVRGLGYRFVAEPGPGLSRRLSGAAAKHFRRS